MGDTWTKDPDATLSYTVDWSDWLVGGDTISSVAWDVPTGITEDSTSETTTTATITLSGGSANADYDVGCKITTAAGLIDERTIHFQVRQR